MFSSETQKTKSKKSWHPIRLCVESWLGLRMWTWRCATLSCVLCRVCVDVRSPRDLIGTASEKSSWTLRQKRRWLLQLHHMVSHSKWMHFFFFYTGITFGVNVASSLNLVVSTFLKRNSSCFFYVQPQYKSHTWSHSNSHSRLYRNTSPSLLDKYCWNISPPSLSPPFVLAKLQQAVKCIISHSITSLKK